MAGSRFPESMDTLARDIIAGLQQRLGSAVYDFAVSETRDAPTPWLTIECTMFDYLPLVFFYDRGRCGFSIDYGSRKIRLARPSGPAGLRSHEDLERFLDEVVVAARERVPDKFLAARGWSEPSSEPAGR